MFIKTTILSSCLATRGQVSIYRMASTQGLVSLGECRRFIVDCMTTVGTPLQHAQQFSELLVAADYRGHFSHGLNRLEYYLQDISKKVCDPTVSPKICNETAAIAWVDGLNGLGPVVGRFCMDLAIKKAKEVGIGFVTAKGSNHYGIAGYYAMLASEQNLIGLSTTNTSPLMVPTRAKDAALGTSPISVAAPGLQGDSVVVDMATTTVAVGKIEVQMKKNAPIPEGWALDENGHQTTDAQRAFKASKLNPLGGSELNSGFKGYGMALIVEILSGVLSGSTIGPHIRKWGTFDRVADISHCFLALDPSVFAPGFQERMSDLMNYLRNMDPVDPNLAVLVPGDPERISMTTVDKVGGIQYHESQLALLVQFHDFHTPLRNLCSVQVKFKKCQQQLITRDEWDLALIKVDIILKVLMLMESTKKICIPNIDIYPAALTGKELSSRRTDPPTKVKKGITPGLAHQERGVK